MTSLHNQDTLKEDLPENDETVLRLEDPVEKSKEECLTEEVQQLKDQLLRALAEAENTRKRSQREREESHKYAVSGLARELLSVSDNLSRALSSVAGENFQDIPLLKTMIQGIEMTQKELLSVFDRHHIQKIEALGAAFDPHLHQAMQEAEDADVDPGTILQVLQEGYRMHERLLRPSLVVVAKKPSEEK